MKRRETIQPDKRTQEQAAQYAKQHTAHNGGREYTHRVDGVSQYPDLKQFSPQNMTAFTIVVNLEMRKHS